MSSNFEKQFAITVQDLLNDVDDQRYDSMSVKEMELYEILAQSSREIVYPRSKDKSIKEIMNRVKRITKIRKTQVNSP